MDCTRFRDLKAAVPNHREPEFLDHQGDCVDCGEFARQIDRMETMLMRTMEIEPPAGFAEQLLLQATPRDTWTQRLLGRIGLGGVGPGLGLGIVGGALASVAAVSVTAFLLLRQAQPIDPLVADLVAHVQAEPQVMHDTMHVEPRALSVAFETYGARLKAPIGEVRHLGECVVNGKIGHHVFVKTPEGEATLILLPGQSNDMVAPQSTQGLSAVVLGLPKGRLGIVADTPARVQNTRQWISRKMEVQG